MSDMTRDQIGAQLANVAFNWAQHTGHTLTAEDCAMLDKLRKQWDAARAQAAPQAPAVEVPKGWKLVPEVPNQSMVRAAKEVDGRLSVFKWADGYYAMLAAAPQPAQEGEPS